MVRWLLLLCVVALPAQAYPWMVKHGYGSCATCHVDPSGSGQLTQYGRAQADILVKWRTQPRKDDEEVSKLANFLWFAELPEVLNLSGNFRYGSLIRPQSGPTFLGGVFIPLLMAADLYVTVNAGPVVLHATTGLGIRGSAGQAAILPSCTPGLGQTCGAQWIAREVWGGVKLADDAVMIRAGRMNLPFGLRNNEHPTFIRALSRTDVNIHQQYGVSISYNSDKLRGEVMGIAGNFNIAPDIYRERGYSAFAEYAFTNSLYLGASSLITYAGADYTTTLPTTRHAHGLFGRIVPTDKLAILTELDFLAFQTPEQLDRLGFAGLVQGDLTVMPGLHVMLTGEAGHDGTKIQGANYAGWLSATWYFFSHCELRVDNIFRRRAVLGGPGQFEYQLLLQLHAYL
ncbi:MAG: hypothetical protein ACO1OB_16760 [Archangium sp.]